MATPEARAAFDEAQRIAVLMHGLHDQEKALEKMKSGQSDAAAFQSLETEIARLRRDWANLAGDYTRAVGRFTAACADAPKRE
jgi:hypothetical protein